MSYANAFDVEKVGDELQALGFEYLVFTNFHGLGTLLNPSKACDKWRGPGYASKRDVTGEIIQASKVRNIGLIMFTHPLDGHDYPDDQKELLGWNDPTDNYKRWNDFVNDVYTELIERYGHDLMGVGFDSDFGLSPNPGFFGKLDSKRLRETILSRAPNLPLLGLIAPNDCCELGMKEVWRPSWLDPFDSLAEDDYDVEHWPSYRRVTAIVQANHGTAITPAEKGVAHLNATQMYR